MSKVSASSPLLLQGEKLSQSILFGQKVLRSISGFLANALSIPPACSISNDKKEKARTFCVVCHGRSNRKIQQRALIVNVFDASTKESHGGFLACGYSDTVLYLR